MSKPTFIIIATLSLLVMMPPAQSLTDQEKMSRNGKNKGIPICHKDNCEFYNSFLIPAPPELHIGKKTLVAEVYSTSTKSIDGWRIRVTSKRRFCSYSLLSENRKCEEWEFQYQSLPLQIVKEIASTGKCPVGRFCARGGDCYGEEAYQCKSSSVEYSRLISPGKDANYDSEKPWENIFHNTCEMLWRCEIEKVDEIIEVVKNGESFDYFVILEGTWIKIAPETPLVVTLNGWNYVASHFTLEEEKLMVSCLFQSGERICINRETRHGLEKGVVFQLDSNCRSHLGSIIIKTHCGSMADDNEDMNLYIKDILDPQNATSLETSMKMAIMILFNNMQGLFNSMVLSSEIQKIHELLKQIILSVSKGDDHFLSTLLGGYGKSTWVNSTMVRICPCVSHEQGSSNCRGKYTYSEGVWKFSSPDDICVYSEEIKNPKNLTLIAFNNTLSTETLTMPKLMPSKGEKSYNPEAIIGASISENGNASFTVASIQRLWVMEILENILDFLRKWSFLAAYGSIFWIAKFSTRSSK